MPELPAGLAVPNVPSVDVLGGAAGGIIDMLVQFSIFGFFILIALGFAALKLGWGQNIPIWKNFVKKFHRNLTIIKQDGNNLKIFLDKGRDFIKNSEQMLEVQSDGMTIPGGIRGDMILYSPAPGKYEPAKLELKHVSEADPIVYLHSMHDDDAARLIFIAEQREIIQRFNIKSFLEKWAGPILAFIGIFIVAILLWQTWGQISSAIGTMGAIAKQQSDTANNFAQIINRTYAPAIPGGK
jgi:hypothetical protein